MSRMAVSNNFCLVSHSVFIIRRRPKLSPQLTDQSNKKIEMETQRGLGCLSSVTQWITPFSLMPE
jgi:hypothetical protein